MSRAVWLRLTAGLVFLPASALLSAECGGNDVLDAADASRDGTFDENGIDARSDAELADRAGDTSSDSGTRDAADAESGPADAAGEAGEAGEAGDAGDARIDGGTLPPVLATAASFALFASSTIINTGASTAIVGDVGISPGTALVGLPAGQVTGTIHLGDGVAAQAAADLAVAYDNLAGRPCQHTMSNIDLGGKTLFPGVYCFGVAATQAADLTLDGQGDPNAVWVFQIGSTLTVSANVNTFMINSGNACNVYWQVGSSATIATGAKIKGNIFAKASITMVTGATISPGRAMAETAAITLDTNTVSNLGCP